MTTINRRADIFSFLTERGIISASPDRREPLADRCRDAPIRVYRDRISGVIYLDPERAGVFEDYYESKDTGGRVYPRNDMDAVDTQRRSNLLTSLISGRRWVDFGCGPGYQIRMDADKAEQYLGVELNRDDVALLRADGFDATTSVDAVADLRPHVITLFHVVEHLREAQPILQRLRDFAAPGAKLIVEVPHARDWLILHGPDEFRARTFWSEHMVLHTRESLRLLLSETGWSVGQVTGVQRYPVWNHLAWLASGAPTGSRAAIWDETAAQLAAAHAAWLAAQDETDTLIATATAA